MKEGYYMLLSAIIATFLNTGAIIFGIILLTKAKSKTAKWYGMFAIAATGGYFVAIIKTFFLKLYPDSLFLLILTYIIAIAGYRFMPYLYLMANLTYSNLLGDSKRKKVAYTLLIPILILFIVDLFNPSVIFELTKHTSKFFWLTAIEAIVYVSTGFILCVVPLFSKKQMLKKTMIVLINFSIIPLTILIYNIISVSNQVVWNHLILVFWAYILVFAFIVWKFKVLGFSFKLDVIENEALNRLIEQAQLTGAEKEVVLLKLQGKTNQEIAKIRIVSLGTIKSQINDIYRKLSIEDIDELAKKLN